MPIFQNFNHCLKAINYVILIAVNVGQMQHDQIVYIRFLNYFVGIFLLLNVKFNIIYF